MKLYEIKNEMLDTLDLLLETEGVDELATENCQEMLSFLKEELEKKSDSILKYIRNLETERDMAKLEITRLDELKKKKEKKIEWLKGYIVSIMLELDKKKIETDLGSYGIRRSSKVEVLDLDKLPNEYVKTKVEKVADKVKIGEFLNKYGNLAGARLVDNYSLQIR